MIPKKRYRLLSSESYYPGPQSCLPPPQAFQKLVGNKRPVD